MSVSAHNEYSTLVVVITSALLVYNGCRSEVVGYTGQAFQSQLEQFADDALGVTAMQSGFQSAARTSPAPVSGSVALNQLASNVASRLQTRFRVARNLQSAARGAYSQGRTRETEPLCCSVRSSDVVFDSRFNTTVTPAQSCDRISATASTYRSTISVTFRQAAASNLAEVPEVKFQYYGSEEGYATIFPGFNTSDCSSYDPRYRPWYVAGAVPADKDVLIVVDTSGSMGAIVSGTAKTRLDLAKDAILSILSVLSDRDRITVLPFNSRPDNIAPASSNLSCFNNALGQATPYNKRLLRYHVDRLVEGGSTYYGTAIKRAYEIYANTSQIPNRDRVILFLSDGVPTDSEGTILAEQERAARQFNYSIVVLTYAMGNNVRSGEVTLRKMASQSYSSPLSGVQRALGEYRLVSNFQNLRASLTRFYSFFASEDTSSSVIYTNPYYDAFGLGVILTVAAPVYTFGGATGSTPVLRGVVGVDITITDLFGDISYFSDDEHQYAFMINTEGHAILHPLLNQPADLSSDPTFQDITLLEVDAAFRDQIYYKMRAKTPGHAVINATRFVTSGISPYEGAQATTVLSSYDWKPVDGTSFILCVVLNMDLSREVASIAPQPAPRSAGTVYHRLDLITTSTPKCNQFGRVATGDVSAVKFSPEAFLDPSYYLNVPENKTGVSQYLAYLDGRSSYNPYFKVTVKDYVRLTALLDSVWKLASIDYTQSVVWRYIGTIGGVFRIIPGTQLPTSYDHLKRGWFTRSINNPGQLILSSPYLDAFGAGFVVTLGTTITQSVNQSSISAVGAVMAVDFTLGYLDEVLQRVYPPRAGLRYIIIDSSGYLVFHPDFLTDARSPEWVHLGHKEPFVMRDLLLKGVLQKQSCARYDAFSRHITYKMVLPGGATSFSSTADCFSSTVSYQFEQVDNSNVYVGFLSSSSCSRKDGTLYQSACSCPTFNGLGRCSSVTVQTCECPCTVDLPVSACNNSFPEQSRQYNVCPAEIFALPVVPRKAGSVSGLSKCSDNPCATISRSGSCRASVGCEWCTRDIRETELERSFCSTDCYCFQGIVGRQNPNAGCDAGSRDGQGGGNNDSGGSGQVVSMFGLLIPMVVCVGTALFP
eukprot:scpid21441/ scgid4711/ VWFA and cache domain-containing protein 1